MLASRPYADCETYIWTHKIDTTKPDCCPFDPKCTSVRFLGFEITWGIVLNQAIDAIYYREYGTTKLSMAYDFSRTQPWQDETRKSDDTRVISVDFS